MFGIGGCEEVKNSEKRESAVAEQKVSDWQMNAWILESL